MPSVAIMDDLDPVAKEILRGGGLTLLPPDRYMEAQAIIVRSRTKVDRNFIDSAPHLKLIVRAGVGLDNIDLKYARERGIVVLNTPKATVISVAELTFGLMLAAARHIPRAHSSTKAGMWEKKRLKGMELYGKRLGIVGMGNIGRTVAERAKAFGMKVTYYDIVEVPGWEKLNLPQLFSVSDVITLHLPLNDGTKGMINYELMSKMKDGAILINTARGGLIPTQDLIRILQEGRVTVALDVFEEEPPPPELLRFDNLIVTPHIGAQTREAQKRAAREAAEAVLKFFNEAA
ncbi:MAG: hydroxyacid dehydrogenase [Thermotogae bacterium]|nr:hydroxyacid dehydrogenase [Thermotogota bacterium]